MAIATPTPTNFRAFTKKELKYLEAEYWNGFGFQADKSSTFPGRVIFAGVGMINHHLDPSNTDYKYFSEKEVRLNKDVLNEICSLFILFVNVFMSLFV